jgi:hypothetical protein
MKTVKLALVYGSLESKAGKIPETRTRGLNPELWTPNQKPNLCWNPMLKLNLSRGQLLAPYRSEFAEICFRGSQTTHARYLQGRKLKEATGSSSMVTFIEKKQKKRKLSTNSLDRLDARTEPSGTNDLEWIHYSMMSFARLNTLCKSRKRS